MNITFFEYAAYLRRKRAQLTKDEIYFIVDFFIQVLQNAQIRDDFSIILGINFFP